MNSDKIKDVISHLSAHDWLTAGIVLAGLVLLVLIIKMGRFLIRLLLFLLVIGLFAGALWWHHQK